jgi:hypothetical protein
MGLRYWTPTLVASAGLAAGSVPGVRAALAVWRWCR